MDFSQNSTSEKQTLHKIQYQKNRFFKKFNKRKTGSSQNLIRHKIQWKKNELFTKFNKKKMDSSQNSIREKQTLHKIQ